MKIKPKYKAEFKVWVTNKYEKDNIVESKEEPIILFLPSIHRDYLNIAVKEKIQEKLSFDEKLYGYELINFKEEKYRKYY